MERTFLKSGRKRISGGANLPHRGKACPNRQTLPVAIRFGLLLFGSWGPANCPIFTQSSHSLVNMENSSIPRLPFI